MNDYKNYNLYIYALTDFYIHLSVSSCLFRQLQLFLYNIFKNELLLIQLFKCM